MGAGVILLPTLITVAALLLGVAAARRRWWLQCKVCASCSAAGATQVAYFAATTDTLALPFWAYVAGYLLVGFLLATAWTMLRTEEKRRTGEGSR